ncbi:MAG: chorismate-binding protein [Steroidobacteraceae bacterium]
MAEPSLREAWFRAWDGNPRWSQRLTSPRVTHVAWSLTEVDALVTSAEHASAAGRWVALALSFEAAAAFVPGLPVQRSGGRIPLAVAAEFEPTSVRSLPPGRMDPARSTPALPLVAALDRAQFRQQVDAVQEAIRAGDTYQVNLTFPLRGPLPDASPAGLFEGLLQGQQPAYAAWLDLGALQVISLSPELFFETEGEVIRARPMKGTARRGRWLEEDLAVRDLLQASPKARAENVMIVDLLRNDLGRLAEPGTVKVSRLYEAERYPTLWQLTSTIEARLPAGTGLRQCLSALFPCGSVTGAPKLSTLKLINALEVEPRGFYTGAIGLLRPGGDAIFNVPIRTLTLDSDAGRATLGVGAGITADSEADAEYEECLLKGQFATQPRPWSKDFQLFETLRLEEGQVLRLDRHLARLRASAGYFGFTFDPLALQQQVSAAIEAHASGIWRLRITLERGGHCRAEASPHEDTRRPWRVALSELPVNETDPLLFNKTTLRAAYDEALAARPDVDDVILANRRGELTESCRANLVLDIGGKKVTPALPCGLLPGVMRAELLERGELVEATLTRDGLQAAERIWLINSLRGWVAAELVP